MKNKQLKDDLDQLRLLSTDGFIRYCQIILKDFKRSNSAPIMANFHFSFG